MELAGWIEKQSRLSAELMSRAISATDLRRVRAQFGQTIVSARGSVLASPAIADWNPEPDYFFHWIRDSAVVMRTVAELAMHAADETERRRWTTCFEDYVTFSLRLVRLDVSSNESHAARTEAAFRKFLRADDDIRALGADGLLGEPRFNPDGTLDVLGWSRPQYDGPALRALACLHFREFAGASAELDALLALDLDFTARHAGEACIGPWEEPEENTHHYYVALVQLGALVHGREFVQGADAEARLRTALERHWFVQYDVYTAIWPSRGGTREDLIDSAVLLGVLDADLADGSHSVADPRVWQTLAALEDLFAREFPINRGRTAPALGRSRADRYFGGGAWYVTTLAAAAMCYRRAARETDMRYLARGDAYMTTVRDLIPTDGHMAEQVDRNTGAPTSARDLTWSYAAFIAAAGLRREAVRSTAPRL